MIKNIIGFAILMVIMDMCGLTLIEKGVMATAIFVFGILLAITHAIDIWQTNLQEQAETKRGSK